MIQPTAPEYIAARTALLDALDALAPQRDSLILVGAQAIYLQTDSDPDLGVARTTDADVALDTDLLVDDPELTAALEDAGFGPGRNPGSWLNGHGVAVDIMVAPHQGNREKTRARSADLPPHGKWLARITSGLEAALVDHAPMTLVALSPDDSRNVTLKVAGPAALLVAKTIKIAERHAEGGHRLQNKDAVDILRLLRTPENFDAMVAGLQAHACSEVAARTSRMGLDFLAEQRSRGHEDVVRRLIATELDAGGLTTQSASYDGLIDELLAACRDSGLIHAPM